MALWSMPVKNFVAVKRFSWPASNLITTYMYIPRYYVDAHTHNVLVGKQNRRLAERPA